MEKQQAVREVLAAMRETLANRDQLPQSYVDSRVINLSTHLATFASEESAPFDWAALSDMRVHAGY